MKKFQLLLFSSLVTIGLGTLSLTNATAATIKTKNTTLTTPGSMRNVSATGKYAPIH